MSRWRLVKARQLFAAIAANRVGGGLAEWLTSPLEARWLGELYVRVS